MTVPLTDAFYSAKRSYERGKYHIQDFNGRLTEFFNSEPWFTVTEINAEGAQFHKFRWTQEPPEPLESIATDAAYNLRAALDQTGYAASVLFGKDDPSHAHFPFGENGREGVVISPKSRCRDLPPEILSVFRSFKPYKAGDHALNALNALCNTNKHSFLVAAEFRDEWAAVSDVATTNPHWDRSRQQIIFASSDGNTSHHVGVAHQIVFQGIPAVEGRPVVRNLDLMLDVVGQIIAATQEACFRNGKIRLAE
jgi:hypothetical protein